MNIGIYTYGTRGDVQPYVALALGLLDKGHQVTLSAPADFKDFVEGFGIAFQPLYGNAEEIMNSPEGQRVLKTEAIQHSQTDEIRNNVYTIGEAIRNENGLANAINEIETYFNEK